MTPQPQQPDPGQGDAVEERWTIEKERVRRSGEESRLAIRIDGPHTSSPVEVIPVAVFDRALGAMKEADALLVQIRAGIQLHAPYGSLREELRKLDRARSALRAQLQTDS